MITGTGRGCGEGLLLTPQVTPNDATSLPTSPLVSRLRSEDQAARPKLPTSAFLTSHSIFTALAG